MPNFLPLPLVSRHPPFFEKNFWPDLLTWAYARVRVHARMRTRACGPQKFHSVALAIRVLYLHRICKEATVAHHSLHLYGGSLDQHENTKTIEDEIEPVKGVEVRL